RGRCRGPGPIPGAVTPPVKGGRVMASHGILELRAHDFGGERETDLQRAWRLGLTDEQRFYEARRRRAHRQRLLVMARGHAGRAGTSRILTEIAGLRSN